MTKNGGSRPGAGRKKGTPNRRTGEILSAAMADGLSPIEFMLTTMRDETADMKDRAWAAEKVAPFVHPRPAPTPRTVSVSLPTISDASSISGAIAAIFAAVGRGEIAPSEAQSLVSIVEAQRKAIETGEMLARIEALEERAGVPAALPMERRN